MYVKFKVNKGYQDNWGYEILSTRKDIRRLRKGWREQRCHRNLIRCPGDQRLSECPSHRRRTRDLKRYFRREMKFWIHHSLATKTGNIWRVDIKRMKSIDKQLMRRSRRRQFFFLIFSWFYVNCSGQEGQQNCFSKVMMQFAVRDVLRALITYTVVSILMIFWAISSALLYLMMKRNLNGFDDNFDERILDLIRFIKMYISKK